MRNQLICLWGAVALTCGCMRDTVTQHAQPTEPTMETIRAPNTPPGAPRSAGPAYGLLEAPQDAPEEFGQVHFGRDLQAALDESATSNKPVFLLFTEVPGCSTVRGFANGALSHPLLVEAIEDEFIPIVIRNNVSGAERAVLDSFGEPTWNNPVVRILASDRSDLVPRYASGWTTEGLGRAMVDALKAAERPVPAYLTRLVAELSADEDRTLFSMYCFWTGEVRLASLQGVVSTRPGFANGKEVVEVTWDRKRTTADRLLKEAVQADAASGVIVTKPAISKVAAKHFDRVEPLRGDVTFSAKDNKYQIRNQRWGWVPMTPGQASAVNRAAVSRDASFDQILSPRQLAFAHSDERLDRVVGPLRAPNSSE